jgi:hypothetical protein
MQCAPAHRNSLGLWATSAFVFGVSASEGTKVTTGSQTLSQQDTLIRQFYTLAARVRTPYWPGVFVSLVALAMLIIFYQVVSQGVQASELRLQTAAVHERANSRCKAMGGRSARDDCFEQIKVGATEIADPLL